MIEVIEDSWQVTQLKLGIVLDNINQQAVSVILGKLMLPLGFKIIPCSFIVTEVTVELCT